MNNVPATAAGTAAAAPNLAQQIEHIQLHLGAGANNDAIPNSWLVQFKKDTPDNVIYDVIKDVNANGGKVTFHYNTIYHGFSAHIPPTYLDNVRGHPLVEKVTPNYKVSMIEPVQPKLELM
ncbi:hypothetical protein BCR44DRAFT_38977 [Catenaria anguillulae PL171]|uniref:Inhibitor I9 domain-containing protein n=1 Tax=Catenaria anguillulae PL171 TaxID=765915 RepID=A0A1Y2HGI5_9FUNG|nr:hypothetical protein BCR44DRAFT_38977 [Catenaria anguillulae PL171]